MTTIHAELAKLRKDYVNTVASATSQADKQSLEQVKAELATVNQTLTAHTLKVGSQLEKMNSAAADRNTFTDEVLLTKLGEDSLTTLHDELAVINQTITAHALWTRPEIPKEPVQSSAGDEMLLTRLGEDTLTTFRILWVLFMTSWSDSGATPIGWGSIWRW